jgi:hypothetical protein
MYCAFSKINPVKEFVSIDHEQGNRQKWWMQAKLNYFWLENWYPLMRSVAV